MSNGKEMEELLRSAKQLDPETLETLKNNPMAENILSRLQESDKKRLMATLSDKEATEKLLASPQAKQILEFLKRGKR